MQTFLFYNMFIIFYTCFEHYVFIIRRYYTASGIITPSGVGIITPEGVMISDAV